MNDKMQGSIPKPGQQLVATFKGKPFKAIVVSVNADATRPKIQVKVGKSTFDSLSAAGKAITGYWVYGYVFWGLKKK